MKKFLGVKAILFDIDDTLFPSSKFSSLARKNAIRAMAASGMKANQATASKSLEKIIAKYGSNYPEHFNLLVEKFECKDKNYSIAAGVWAYHSTKASICAFEGTPKLLFTLMRNYTLCVASEGREIKQWDKLIRLGLDKSFSHVFVTNTKNKNFYVKLAKKLGLEPCEILMVGDNPKKDIFEAKKAGFKTIRIKTGKHCDEPDVADSKIASLHNLLGLLV